jgi:uncharacterized protein (TIGR03435 family)
MILRFAIGAGLLFLGSMTDPAFEVASVKPNRTVATAGSMSRSGGRLIFDNDSLRECIEFAYGIAAGRDYELVGPAWLYSEKFDIAATFPAETSRGMVRRMLQTLLADRFNLKTHRESKKMKAFALLASKSGPSLERTLA